MTSKGVVSQGYPILQRIPDVVEPASGYLWTNLAKHGKTLYHFGEYISSTFCGEGKTANSQDGPMLAGRDVRSGRRSSRVRLCRQTGAAA